MSDSVYMCITDSDDDDFIHSVFKVKASSCGTEVVWKLPKRLMQNPDLLHSITDELLAELRERIDAKAVRQRS